MAAAGGGEIERAGHILCACERLPPTRYFVMTIGRASMFRGISFRTSPSCGIGVFRMGREDDGQVPDRNSG
jgi:hypothetical protein